MKKIILNIIFIAIAILSVVSCTKDETKSTATLITDTKLVNPVASDNIITNPNVSGDTAITVKWTSADFGYSASVVYVLQIVNSTDSFSTSPQSITIGTFNENSNATHAFALSNTVLNTKLYKLLGNTVSNSSSFKMRVFGQPVNQLAAAANAIKTYSQEVVFTSNVYDPILETPKIYVFGNFGAASTYADWDINMDGTSNSPLIYAPASNEKYSGFIYMNVASPLFKFAKPTATDLNIKGFATSPVGTSDGTIVSSTDISTGNVISAPVSSTTKTYYVTADWTNNKYNITSRKLSIRGTAVGGASVAKSLDYVTDPTSPYYRMYVNTNVTLSLGSAYIQLKDNSIFAADRMGIDPNNTYLQISPNSSSSLNNKMVYGASTPMNVTVSGSYTIVLDLRNSAVYNLRAIPN